MQSVWVFFCRHFTLKDTTTRAEQLFILGRVTLRWTTLSRDNERWHRLLNTTVSKSHRDVESKANKKCWSASPPLSRRHSFSRMRPPPTPLLPLCAFVNKHVRNVSRQTHASGPLCTVSVMSISHLSAPTYNLPCCLWEGAAAGFSNFPQRKKKKKRLWCQSSSPRSVLSPSYPSCSLTFVEVSNL